jgi:hypothetical protein
MNMGEASSLVPAKGTVWSPPWFLESALSGDFHPFRSLPNSSHFEGSSLLPMFLCSSEAVILLIITNLTVLKRQNHKYSIKFLEQKKIIS